LKYHTVRTVPKNPIGNIAETATKTLTHIFMTDNSPGGLVKALKIKIKMTRLY